MRPQPELTPVGRKPEALINVSQAWHETGAGLASESGPHNGPPGEATPLENIRAVSEKVSLHIIHFAFCQGHFRRQSGRPRVQVARVEGVTAYNINSKYRDTL